MNKAARYVIENGFMIENQNGAFMLADDYDALQQKLDALAAENARMLEDYRDIPGMRRIGAPLSPATSAYLNSVRAEGAEMVERKLMRMCEVAARNDKETIHALSLKAGQIADQLRAGEVK